MTTSRWESLTGARRQQTAYVRDAEEAEGRARELRRLATTAGPGTEADAWQKQAEFFDRVGDAHRRMAAELDKHLKHPMFENVTGFAVKETS